MKKQEIEEMERQHAAAYTRIPSEPAEFEEWESEQVWLEDEEGSLGKRGRAQVVVDGFLQK